MSSFEIALAAYDCQDAGRLTSSSSERRTIIRVLLPARLRQLPIRTYQAGACGCHGDLIT
jgi:hypothetical protein